MNAHYGVGTLLILEEVNHCTVHFSKYRSLIFKEIKRKQLKRQKIHGIQTTSMEMTTITKLTFLKSKYVFFPISEIRCELYEIYYSSPVRNDFIIVMLETIYCE